MNMIQMANTEPVARRIEGALDGRSVRWLSEQSGIPYTTLNRRFLDGNFTLVELYKIAGVLDLAPAALVGDAA